MNRLLIPAALVATLAPAVALRANPDRWEIPGSKLWTCPRWDLRTGGLFALFVVLGQGDQASQVQVLHYEPLSASCTILARLDGASGKGRGLPRAGGLLVTPRGTLELVVRAPGSRDGQLVRILDGQVECLEIQGVQLGDVGAMVEGVGGVRYPCDRQRARIVRLTPRTSTVGSGYQAEDLPLSAPDLRATDLDRTPAGDLVAADARGRIVRLLPPAKGATQWKVETLIDGRVFGAAEDGKSRLAGVDGLRAAADGRVLASTPGCVWEFIPEGKLGWHVWRVAGPPDGTTRARNTTCPEPADAAPTGRLEALVPGGGVILTDRQASGMTPWTFIDHRAESTPVALGELARRCRSGQEDAARVAFASLAVLADPERVDTALAGIRAYAGSSGPSAREETNIPDLATTDRRSLRFRAALALHSTGQYPDGPLVRAAREEATAASARQEDGDRTWTVATVAGGGERGSADGWGKAASFTALKGLAAGGNTFVAVADGSAVRLVGFDGRVATVLGRVDTPGRLDPGRVTPTGASGREDTFADQVCLDDPQGLAFDGGMLLIADRNNHCLVGLNPYADVLAVMAGDRGAPESRQGLLRDALASPQPDVCAALGGPAGICVDPGEGTVMIACADAMMALDHAAGQVMVGSGPELQVELFGLPAEAGAERLHAVRWDMDDLARRCRARAQDFRGATWTVEAGPDEGPLETLQSGLLSTTQGLVGIDVRLPGPRVRVRIQTAQGVILAGEVRRARARARVIRPARPQAGTQPHAKDLADRDGIRVEPEASG